MSFKCSAKLKIPSQVSHVLCKWLRNIIVEQMENNCCAPFEKLECNYGSMIPLKNESIFSSKIRPSSLYAEDPLLITRIFVPNTIIPIILVHLIIGRRFFASLYSKSGIHLWGWEIKERDDGTLGVIIITFKSIKRSMCMNTMKKKFV